jgi:NADPH-dependent glutamate synthase beta subunit-like oxidoreductase
MKCQAGKWGSPIAVRALKRFAADYAAKRSCQLSVGSCQTQITENRQLPTDNCQLTTVAVVGSGPAGLLAA